MALQTISIHFAVGEVVEPRGTDRIAIGNDVDLFLGFGDAAVVENAQKLIRAARALLERPGGSYVNSVECDCEDPTCPKVHPVDRLDAIDEAKRAREIAEQDRRFDEQVAEAEDDAWTNREGQPEFNGAFR